MLNKKTFKKIYSILVKKFLKIRLQDKYLNLEDKDKFFIQRYTYEVLEDSFNYYKEFFAQALIFDNILKHQEKCCEYVNKTFPKTNLEEVNLFEFGVWKGDSANTFARLINEKKIYAFDAFDGYVNNLEGDISFGHNNFAVDYSKLFFNEKIVVEKGIIEKTLPIFIDKFDKKININFLSLDLANPETTSFVIKKLKLYFSDKCLIYTNGLHNTTGWKVMTKSFFENFNKDELDYYAFTSNGQISFIFKKK